MLFLISLCALIQFGFTYNDSNPIIATKNGPYRGEKRENYYAFEGIRYAQPPVGILRFQAPVAYNHLHWQVVDARKPGSPCIQNIFGAIVGEEDCLFINIYTGNLNEKEKQPVVVYIHGGGFIFGSGVDYGPGHLMNRKIIYVNFNYRLGPMGFLSAGDREISGNMGLKDQVMALKFIQENIAAFGGDPKNVMIVGWSAGGASVQFHYLSNMSKGLFARGISHSGSVFNPWVWQSNPDWKFNKVCTLVGCDKRTLQEKIHCLRNIPAGKIVETVNEFQPFRNNPFNPFGVVIEKFGNCNTKFISETPEYLLKKEKIQKLPWIATHVKDEGYFPLAKLLTKNDSLSLINDRFDKLMQFILHFPVSSYGKTRKITESIRKEYIGKMPVNEDTKDYFVKIITDYMYVVGIHKSIQLQSTMMPVYSYKFDYKTKYGYGEFLSERDHVTGVAHGEDIALIYETSLRTTHPYTLEEKAVMNILLDMYETFAYSGSPVLGTMSMLPTISKDNITFTLIRNATDLEVITNADLNKISDKQFWENIEQKLIMASSSISQLFEPKMTMLIFVSVLILTFS